ncbi:hypothetical protein TYRP_009288 [Tyrophagus putrescentiae]|nr:hypothetical protein TYRP_009288 [Tyrophagus putrescentiae]
MAKIITSFAENDTMASLTLAPIGWHPRPNSGLKIITITTTRAPVPMLVFFIFFSFFPFLFRQQPMASAVDTGGRSAEKVGNTSHKWCAASAWSVSTALSSLHICWVIKRSGPSRYYCPSSDVGGPKRTVDKDGRLSEDGEADGNKVLGCPSQRLQMMMMPSSTCVVVLPRAILEVRC